jgi:hypothetical protein
MLRQRKPLVSSSTISIPSGDSSSLVTQLSRRKRESRRGNIGAFQIIGFFAILISFFAISKRSQNKDGYKDRNKGVSSATENKIDAIIDSTLKTYPKLRNRLGNKQLVPNPEFNSLHHSNGRKERVICSDGSSGILNDDFCDCVDGSDEPRTTACSHLNVQSSIFDCGDGILFIFASRVHDGIVDCPDGSDERT